MTDAGTSKIHGFYERLKDGKRYEYRGKFTHGPGGSWDATFFYNGDEQRLSGAALLSQESAEEQTRAFIEFEMEDWIEQRSKEL